jgi:hypothetical protein
MVEVEHSEKELAKGVRLTLGKPTVIRLVPHRKKLETIDLVGALFRTNSAVLMPEGETPIPVKAASGVSQREALTTVGILASVLRFIEEHPDRKLLLAGHTDTVGQDKDNQTLSEERVAGSLAVLMGDRQSFIDIAEGRHKVSDYKQILRWVAQQDFIPGFGGCDPGKIDDVEGTGVAPVKAFQDAYNQNKASFLPEAEALKVDGSVGPKTWGAFFDIYEAGLRDELGSDANQVSRLRGQLKFLLEDKPGIGFGEKHPKANAGKDNKEELANRRVEFLLFRPDELPDLSVLRDTPQESEIFDPVLFSPTAIPILESAKPWRAKWADPTKPATSNEAREAGLTAPGLASGTLMRFTFTAESNNQPLAQFKIEKEVPAASGSVKLPFADWFGAGMGADRKLVSKFPRVRFRFTVEGGGRKVTSDFLAFSDTLNCVLKHSSTSKLAANTEVRISTPWGFQLAKTDDQGNVKLPDLPPGGALLVGLNFRLESGIS